MIKLPFIPRWVVVLFLMAAISAAVTHHFFAWVTVSGNSMWPQLRHGETLILRRRVEGITPGDVAVFDVAETQVVKTVGFVGPGWFSIRSGDLYSGSTRDGVSRSRLTPDAPLNRTQLVLSALSESQARVHAGRVSISDDHQYLLMDATFEPAELLFPAGGFFLSRVNADGRPLPHSVVANDVLISFRILEGPAPARFSLWQVLDGHEMLAVTIESTEAGWRIPRSGHEPVEWAPGTKVTIGFVDGAVWLMLPDGVQRALSSRSDQRANQLSQLCLRAEGGRVTLSHVTVLGDAHWGTDLHPPVFVPSEAVFLLGDNPGLSEDSRSFGPVPLRQLVGIPVSLDR